MESNTTWIVAGSALIVIQGCIGFALVRYGWRSWRGLANHLSFLAPPQPRYLRRLFGEERYRERVAYLQRRSVRRLFSAINFTVGLFLLLLAAFYLGAAAYDLPVLHP